jgi:hypothetical protein
MASPEDAIGWPKGKEQSCQENQEAVFQKFVANVHFPGPASAVKLDRTERDGTCLTDGEGAMEHNQGERDEHQKQNQCGAPNGDASQQQQPTENLKPRERNRDGIQHKVTFDDLVFVAEA